MLQSNITDKSLLLTLETNTSVKMSCYSRAGLAGGIYRRYLPPVFTGKYRRGQYSQKWRLPAFTGIYKYFINFSSNYIVDSPSYLLYYTWTP